jgi:uncharacterized lipoprotein YehR (DUF1307 family)
MFHLKKATLLTAILLLMLTACGDNHSSKTEKCVIGESEIGDCKL